ncbi:MAG: peptidylprolyl isomerase [Acidimicrobiia bacterium]|nr:MAG: peptidylprolyl isomerase [Acidimicrobiia bacterium]
MTYRTRIAVLIALVALVLAACGGANIAATVNGKDIPDADVLALGAAAFDTPTVGAEEFRNLLTNTIFTEAMVTAAEADFGVENLDAQASIDAYIANIAPAELNILQSVAANPQLSDEAVNLVAAQLLVRSTVKEQIANDPEYLEGVWQNNQDQLVQVCARNIIVETEQEAQVARERIDAGEDFSAVADEVSLDTQSPGGVLPCPTNPSVFIQSFSSVVATAPVGETVGPVQTDFGWHVVLVDSREFPASLDELAEDPLRWIPGDLLDAAWSNWLNDAVSNADISVRSQIGTWYPPVDGIIPPPASP